MNHGSLFSGVGGFDLAASWLGWENIFQVEKDEFCKTVLAKNFPGTKRYGDIYEFDGRKYSGTIDILTAGFPCQPFSMAGKQRGKNDDRYLWPEVLRVIREVRPRWVVGENVAGIIKLALDEVLSNLEAEGYATETFVIPACAINAPHRRDRVWIAANNESGTNRRHNRETEARQASEPRKSDGNCASENSQCHGNSGESERALQTEGSDSTSSRSAGEHGKKYEHGDKFRQKREERICGRDFYEPPWEEAWLDVATKLCRVDDGIPRQLDRVNRLKALGNAIVPQVAYQIFKSIEKTERLR